MDARLFGSLGARVPVIGIGTWKMEGDDRKSAIAAIRRAVDIGLTHVDTAELYGSGKVETLVGEALDGLRDRVFLVSKVLPRNATYAGTIKACERSLERLRTDRDRLGLDVDTSRQHPGHQHLGEPRAFDRRRAVREHGGGVAAVAVLARAAGRRRARRLRLARAVRRRSALSVPGSPHRIA